MAPASISSFKIVGSVCVVCTWAACSGGGLGGATLLNAMIRKMNAKAIAMKKNK